MAPQVKLKKYIVLVDYTNNIDGRIFDDFNVWAYSRHHAIEQVKEYLFPMGSIPIGVTFSIYKLRVTTFINRLFNKVPETPTCVHI